jgi:acetyl-CoA synthetase
VGKIIVQQTDLSGKPVGIKDNADKALPLIPGVEKVIVVKRTGQPVQMKEGRDVW